MKQETANTGSLRALAKEKSFLQRLFEGLLREVHDVAGAYYGGRLDQAGVIAKLKEIVAGLESLSEGGDVHRILTRAEMVILDGVCRDISAAAEGDVTGD